MCDEHRTPYWINEGDSGDLFDLIFRQKCKWTPEWMSPFVWLSMRHAKMQTKWKTKIANELMSVILHRAIRIVQYIKLNFSIKHLRSVSTKHVRIRYVMLTSATTVYVWGILFQFQMIESVQSHKTQNVYPHICGIRWRCGFDDDSQTYWGKQRRKIDETVGRMN